MKVHLSTKKWQKKKHWSLQNYACKEKKRRVLFFYKSNNERSNADILQKKIDELKEKLREKTK